jgi:predicted GNAT superfamily acetyltransferase
MSKFTIKPLTTVQEIAPVEEIQLQAWGRGERLVIPKHLLHALQYNGSILLGAYDGEQMVGYTFGVLGTVPNLKNRIDQVAAARLQLYSHHLAVLPSYQGQGVGLELKLAQREYADKIGLRRISWTFDPLVTRNAWLNIGRLGGISNTYLTNFYGVLDGDIPSDRLYLEWWITSNRVKSRIDQQRKPLSYEALVGGGAILVNEASRNEQGILQPAEKLISYDQSFMVLVEVPANHKEIAAVDETLGLAWRTHIRHTFLELFAQGYVATDFARQTDDTGQLRCYYFMTHQDAGQIIETM